MIPRRRQFEVPPGSSRDRTGAFGRCSAIAATMERDDWGPHLRGEAGDVSREDDVVEATRMAVVAMVESAADDSAGLARDEEWGDREPKRAEALEAGATDV